MDTKTRVFSSGPYMLCGNSHKVGKVDTKTLVVGQDVFMRSGEVGDWGKVVEVTPTGVIVQSDPNYGDQLIRFDKNGIACDSSDIDVDGYKGIVLFDYDKTGYLAPASCDVDVDIESVKAIVSQYDETGLIPTATFGSDKLKFRQRFWENFERLKTHSRYSKIRGTSSGPWKLYFNFQDAGFVKGMPGISLEQRKAEIEEAKLRREFKGPFWC
jgi:hypothetical protein